MPLPIQNSANKEQGSYKERFKLTGQSIVNDVFGNEFPASQFSKYSYSFGMDAEKTFALLSLLQKSSLGAKLVFHCAERKNKDKKFLIADVEVKDAPLAAKAKKPMPSNPRFAPAANKINHVNIYGDTPAHEDYQQAFSLHVNNEQMTKLMSLVMDYLKTGVSLMIDVNEKASKFNPGTTYLDASIRVKEKFEKKEQALPTADETKQKIEDMMSSKTVG